MDDHDKFLRLARHRERHRAEAAEEYRRQSRQRLRKIIETKLNTTMIGALSAVEQYLGSLWGHDKDPRDLSPRERQMADTWAALRTEILNNGNAQKRAALAEIDEYDVSWKQYHIDLSIDGGPEDDDPPKTINPRRTE